MNQISILLRIALQGLFARRINLLLGGLVAAATIVLMLAAAVLITVRSSINSAIIECCIGHVVVWSKDTSPGFRDSLNLVPENGTFPRLGPIDGYDALEQELEAIPGVRVALPLGLVEADLHGQNLMDRLIARTRRLYAAGAPAGAAAQREELKAHLRYIVASVRENLARAASVSDPRLLAADLAAMEQAASEPFWTGFDAAPEAALDFLEGKVAPQLDASSMADVSFIMAGTDIPEYLKGVPRSKLVMGGPVPVGQRGALLNQLYYEESMKHPVAFRLDQLVEAHHDGDRIAEDSDLQQRVNENVALAARIALELGPTRGAVVQQRLREALALPEAELPALLEALVKVDDGNVVERARLFYDVVAPQIDLYSVGIGDDMVLKVTGTDGYTRSVRVKLYGIISFVGAEKSFFADVSLLDLKSFSEIYGAPTPELDAELAAMRADAQLGEARDAETLRAELEDSLFTPIEELQPQAFAAPPPQAGRAELSQTFDPLAVRNRSVVVSSLRLHDAGDIPAVISAVQEVGRKHGVSLGAVRWDEAMGTLKVFPDMVLFVLYVAAGLVLLAVTLTLTHSVMTTTFQRTQELGTLRALGAQAGFVMALVLLEVLLVTALAVMLGFAIGGPLLWSLATEGISSEGSPFLRVLFGDRLYPTLAPAHVAVLFGSLLAITALAALWPSIHALRIPAVRAMQSEE